MGRREGGGLFLQLVLLHELVPSRSVAQSVGHAERQRSSPEC